MPNRTRPDKRRRNKDKFLFTNDLSLIKPYVDYQICIEKIISRFGPTDVILYNNNVGFALIEYKDFALQTYKMILFVWILFI